MNTSSPHNQILEEGQVVAGKWEILSFIARGGKGEVYQARQLNLDRYVAVKVMSREFLQSLVGREVVCWGTPFNQEEIEPAFKRGLIPVPSPNDSGTKCIPIHEDFKLLQ